MLKRVNIVISSNQENREFPLFSIVIAAYNRLPLLKEAVISALDQSLKSSEGLVIDDGSDEETKAWLIEKSHKIDRMRVIFRKTSRNILCATSRTN